jgi:ribosomal protein S19
VKSSWKIIYFTEYTKLNLSLKKKKGINNAFSVNTVTRNALITKDFIFRRVALHNGLKYCFFTIKPEMVGFRFGAFNFTKKMGGKIHSKKIKKK